MRSRSASVSVGIFARRPAGAEKVNAGVDLTASEPPHRRFVEFAACGKRRDQRCTNSRKWRSHAFSPAGLTVNGPDEGGLKARYYRRLRPTYSQLRTDSKDT